MLDILAKDSNSGAEPWQWSRDKSAVRIYLLLLDHPVRYISFEYWPGFISFYWFRQEIPGFQIKIVYQDKTLQTVEVLSPSRLRQVCEWQDRLIKCVNLGLVNNCLGKIIFWMILEALYNFTWQSEAMRLIFRRYSQLFFPLSFNISKIKQKQLRILFFSAFICVYSNHWPKKPIPT